MSDEIDLSLPQRDTSPEALRTYARERAQAKGLDPDLVEAQITHESNWDPKAIPVDKKTGKVLSSAKGLGQLIDSTAKRFNVQDPFDPYQNIEGMTDYLKVLNNQFKDPKTATVAYMQGEGSMAREGITPNGEKYWKDIQSKLPKKSNNDEINLALNDDMNLDDSSDINLDIPKGSPVSFEDIAKKRIGEGVTAPWKELDQQMQQDQNPVGNFAGVTMGLPLGLAMAIGSVGEHALNALGVATDPTRWSLDEFHKALTDPTIASKAQDWLKKNAPSFTTGSNLVNAPFASAFGGITGAVATGAESLAQQSGASDKTASDVGDIANEVANFGLVAAPVAGKLLKGKKAPVTETVKGEEPTTPVSNDIQDVTPPEPSTVKPSEYGKPVRGTMTFDRDTRNEEIGNYIKEDLYNKENTKSPELIEAEKENDFRSREISPEAKAAQEDAMWSQEEQDRMTERMKAMKDANITPDTEVGKALMKAINDNKRLGQTSFGSKQRGGPKEVNGPVDLNNLKEETSRWEGVLPINTVKDLKGLFGENKNPNPESLKFLREQMKSGDLPDPNDKPIIVVDGKGNAAMYDGNHRLMVAKESGWKSLPVKVIFYDGGEKNIKEAFQSKPIARLGQTKFGASQRGGAKEEKLPKSINDLYNLDTPAAANIIDMFEEGTLKKDDPHLSQKIQDLYRAHSDEEKISHREAMRAGYQKDNEAQLLARYMEAIKGKPWISFDDWKKQTGVDKLLGQTKFGDKERGGPKQEEPPKENKGYERQRDIGGYNTDTVETFMEKHGIPTNRQDMNSPLGFGTGPTRTKNPLRSHWDDPDHASHLVNFLSDKMFLLKNVAEEMITSYQPDVKAFNDHYNLSGHFSKFKTDLARHDMVLLAGLEKYPELWFDGKNYSPTKAQLVEAGLSPGSANVWAGHFRTIEKAWPYLEESMRMIGEEPPPRVPGYIPHLTRGPWKVLVGNKDNPSDVVSAWSRREAQNKASYFQNKGKKSFIDEPTPGPDVGLGIEAAWQHKNSMSRKEGMQNVMQDLWKRSAQGMIKQAMERSESPAGLFDLDRFGKELDKDLQLTPKKMQKALRDMQQVYASIPTWWTRARFLTENLFPLDVEGYFEDVPHAQKHVMEYMKSYFKIPDTSSGHIDNFVRGFLVKAGYDPAIIPKLAQMLTSGFSKWFLMYSPPFWIVNSFQHIAQVPVLLELKAQGLLNGEKTASIIKTLGLNMSTTSGGIKLSNGKTLRQHAQDTGKTEPQYVENMDPGSFRDPVAVAIDEFTRREGYKAGFNYARQIMPEKEALNVASQTTDMVNVNYSKEQGQPFFPNKEGVIFRPLFMFFTYQAHQLQMIGGQLRTMSQAIRKGNPQALAVASGSLLSTLAIQYTLWGLTGIPLMQNWDQVTHFLAKSLGIDWPDSKQLARTWKDFLKLPGGDDAHKLGQKIAEHGLVSHLLGYDVESSGTGAALQIPEAFAKGVMNLGALMLLSGRQIFSPTGQKPTIKEWGEAADTLPRIIKGIVQYALRDGTIKGKILGTEPDMAPMHNDINMPGDYKRSTADTVMALLTGLKSNKESEVRQSEQIDQKENEIRNMLAGRLEQTLKEGRVTGPERQQILFDLMKMYWKNPEIVMSAVVKYRVDKAMTETQRKSLSLDSYEAVKKFQQWKQIRGSE